MLEQAVTSNLTSIPGKLGKMIRMLAFDRNGNVIAAARAIKRTLRSEGQIHVLAEGIEQPNGGALTEADMRKLYDAGYDAGRGAAEDQHHGAAHLTNIGGTPFWHEIPLWCLRTGACARRNANSSTTLRRARPGARRWRSRTSSSRAFSTALEGKRP